MREWVQETENLESGTKTELSKVGWRGVLQFIAMSGMKLFPALLVGCRLYGFLVREWRFFLIQKKVSFILIMCIHMCLHINMCTSMQIPISQIPGARVTGRCVP